MKNKIIKRRKEELVDKSTTFYKAWLITIGVLSLGNKLNPDETIVPNYVEWPKKKLLQEVIYLEESFNDCAKKIFKKYNIKKSYENAKWFSKKHDEWLDQGGDIFILCRVHVIQQKFGLLVCNDSIDCPPYAEVILQGLIASAIRHPEYHLARDVALLFNLAFDLQKIMDDKLNNEERHSIELCQSLCRSTILSLFNLLESFASGIAWQYILDNPNTSDEIIKKLSNDKIPLWKKLVKYPEIITGKSDVFKSYEREHSVVFTKYKINRDSYVHCVPGSQLTKWGYNKESLLHSANFDDVAEAIDVSFSLIRKIWKLLHEKEGPSWLPKLGDDKKFENISEELSLISLKSY